MFVSVFFLGILIVRNLPQILGEIRGHPRDQTQTSYKNWNPHALLIYPLQILSQAETIKMSRRLWLEKNDTYEVHGSILEGE